MKQFDVVVVGGSAAGITAAITCRRHYPDKRVLLVRKEAQVLIPCGIPYTFGTVGGPENDLIPDAVLEKNNIELLVDEVVDMDCQERTVTTAGGETIGYQRLILATGSVPIMPPIPGLDKENIFAIKKEVSHLNRMCQAMDTASDLVIVGCGFIGVEIAEECRRRHRDVNIRIVEMLRHCLQLVYDEGFCVRAEEALRGQGVDLLLDEKVEAFLGNGKVSGVRLASGREIAADMVIMGIGATPNVALVPAGAFRSTGTCKPATRMSLPVVTVPTRYPFLTASPLASSSPRSRRWRPGLPGRISLARAGSTWA